MEYVGITNGVIALVRTISRATEHYHLNKTLEELDLEAKLETIELYINEMGEIDGLSKSTQCAANFVKESIVQIHGLLNIIERKMANPDNRWFAGYRAPNYNPEIEKLLIAEQNMMQRFYTLCRLHHM